MKSLIIGSILIGLLILLLVPLPIHINLRIMTYNIKDFWLRFDGEPNTITNQGAELDRDDFNKLQIAAGIINSKKPEQSEY